MMFKFVLVLNFCAITIQSSFIVNFMISKNINSAVLLDCRNSIDSIKLQKDLQKHNIRTTIFYAQTDDCSINFDFFHKTAVVLDSKCVTWFKNFDCVQVKNKRLRSSLTFLIISSNFTNTVSFLMQYPLAINSDVIIANKINNSFQLYETYNPGYNKSGKFKQNLIGYWNLKPIILNSSRRDLEGINIKCVVIITDLINMSSMQYLESLKPIKSDNVHKSKFFTMLTYLEDMLNFRCDIIRTNSWGYVRNGSFDGLVGSLHRETAEIGGSPVFIRKDRSEFVHYVAETWQSRHCFFFRHPKISGSFYTIYTRPLGPSVWYSTIALIGILAIYLSVMVKLKPLKVPGDEKDSSSSLAILSVWSAVCQQGMVISRDSISIKILTFITFVFALTLYQYYNAIVVSTLLKEPSKTIKTLKDLTDSDLKAGAEDAIYLKDFFKNSKDPNVQKLYSQKVVTKDSYNFFKPEHGMALVKQGGFAFHVDAVAAYKIMRTTFSERELCDIQEVLMFPPQKMGAVVTKNSSYKEMFAICIRKIVESGLFQRIKAIWDEPRPACVGTPDTAIFGVSIIEFASVLILLLIGYVFSVFILLAEIVMFRFKNHKLRM